VRPYDFIGRYGGEEFLIIIPSCSPSDLPAGAERLRFAIANKPVETSVGPVPCTISLGVASAPIAEAGFSELEALLRVSDEALYRAKDNGRNRVEIASARRSMVAGAV
jgi:diguanylate cyclase (GGDEF)-like protein